MILGTELIKNGDFANTDNWTLGAGWSISSDQAHSDSSVGELKQLAAFVDDAEHILAFTASGGFVGGLGIRLGDLVTGASVTSSGLYSLPIVAGHDTSFLEFLVENAGDFIGYIDGVSLKQILAADLVIGTDTYVTIVEADSYFVSRYGYESWMLLDESSKQQALASAFSQMNAACTWFTDLTDPYPQGLKDAQCEIAFAITVTGSTSSDGGDPLTELKAGSVTLKFEAGSSDNPLVSDLTSQLLSEYGICSSSGGTSIIPMELT